MNIIAFIFIAIAFVTVVVMKYRLHSAVVHEAGQLEAEHRSLWEQHRRAPIQYFVVFIGLLGVVFFLSLNSESNAEALMSLPVIAWLAATFSWVDRRRIMAVLEPAGFPAPFFEAVQRLKAFEWGVLSLFALIWTGFAFASFSRTFE